MNSQAQREGLRKAAVFLAGLNRSAADRILSELDPRIAEQLRREIALPEAKKSAREMRSIFGEFLAAWKKAPIKSDGQAEEKPSEAARKKRSETVVPIVLDQTAGPSDERLLFRLFDRKRSTSGEYRVEGASSGASSPHFPVGISVRGESCSGESVERGGGASGIFAHWATYSPEEIRSRVIRERPQTIAAVLNALPAELALKTLECFGPSTRREIAERMDRACEVDAEVLRLLEQSLA